MRQMPADAECLRESCRTLRDMLQHPTHDEARRSAPLALDESNIPRQSVPTAPAAVISGYTHANLAGDTAICTPPLCSHDPGESQTPPDLAYMCQVMLLYCTSGIQTQFLCIDLASHPPSRHRHRLGMELHGLGDPLMLEKIDRLFACGVGEHVDLPQIVVVGDQSSGKSSVLEGLVEMAFPRDSGLCTRFATQIVFKRSKEERIAVSIIADRNSAQEQRAEMEAWSKEDLQSLDGDAFPNIMREVCGSGTIPEYH
jgi:hypothetical protein